MWFPRPSHPDDIEYIGGGTSLSDSSIFALLTDDKAQEWPEKVGVVVGDGSAKTTTRLLESGGWVFKSTVPAPQVIPHEQREQWQQQVEWSQRLRLWHPEKIWFLLHQPHEGVCWAMSACPTLTTLWNADTPQKKMLWWTRMLKMALAVFLEHQVCLDLSPSNFAYIPGKSHLYYLDEEFYAASSFQDFGEAIVTRILENPDFDLPLWQEWGAELQQALSPAVPDRDAWLEILDGIQSYPLVHKWLPSRTALLEGVVQGHKLLDPRVRRQQRASVKRTCIFSDIHANLPALESVLRGAQEMGADSYLFLGDVVGYGPFPDQCIERIRALPNLVALMGNHDFMVAQGVPEDGCNRLARESILWSQQRLSAEQRQWLLSLPKEHKESQWMAVHGAPMDPQRIYAYVYEMSYKENLQHLSEQGVGVCFYGHTHVPFIYRRSAAQKDEKLAPAPIQLFHPQQILLINPGSVGQPRDRDPRAAFAIWDRVENLVTFHRVAYSIDTVADAIRQHGLSDDLAIRLEMGW